MSWFKKCTCGWHYGIRVSDGCPKHDRIRIEFRSTTEGTKYSATDYDDR